MSAQKAGTRQAAPLVPASAAAAPAVPSRAPTARGRARRAQIVEAALHLFAASGYSAVSLRDVAAAAGITHPGLLRHFAGKGEILAEVIADLEERSRAAWADQPAGARLVSALQRWNDEDPARSGVITMLSGEAGPDGHPAHAAMAARYRRVRWAAQEELRARAASGGLRDGADPAGEAMRLTAAWDGLGLIARYRPEGHPVDVAAALAAYEEHLRAWPPPAPCPPADRTDPPALPDLAEALVGPEAGQARRDRIVEVATGLFAERGFVATSMQDIAARVGVSKAALFHHYPAKSDLLGAVLAMRDLTISEESQDYPRGTAVETLRGAVAGARRNAELRPGLIEVYAVLSCEASVPQHPAHGYFAARFARALSFFEGLFRAAAAEGSLRAGLDPDAEALWFLALWDGLQFQWMYEPELVSVPDQLDAHLDTVLATGTVPPTDTAPATDTVPVADAAPVAPEA
ncbi:TetR/AcrR family transcriptional regulator [Microbacterium sp. 22242]|uniref:TetR/AcrR family transcriptional regulator n=1 Tax=Microbacterium sp. 22242 TaxID=3453896 RepID=UPI003F831AA8